MEYEVHVRPNKNKDGSLGYATALLKEADEDIMVIQNIKLIKNNKGQFRIVMPVVKRNGSLLPGVIIKDSAFKIGLANAIYEEYKKKVINS